MKMMNILGRNGFLGSGRVIIKRYWAELQLTFVGFGDLEQEELRLVSLCC